MSHHSNLCVLDLTGNRIQRLGRALEPLRKLRRLHLGSNMLTSCQGLQGTAHHSCTASPREHSRPRPACTAPMAKSFCQRCCACNSYCMQLLNSMYACSSSSDIRPSRCSTARAAACCSCYVLHANNALLLAGLCNLQELTLVGNSISSLQPLNGLSGLQVLSAAHNHIATLDGVQVGRVWGPCSPAGSRAVEMPLQLHLAQAIVGSLHCSCRQQCHPPEHCDKMLQPEQLDFVHNIPRACGR